MHKTLESRKVIFFVAAALLAFGVAMRLFPHLPNATPITAIAFAGSFYLGRRWVMALPLFALLASDFVIGFYDWRIMASVYGSFALIACWSYVSRTYGGLFPVFLSIVGSSLFFFFITNGAVWLFSPWYEKSIAGLLYAYELGIPFLRNMLLGDLIYSSVLFGVFELGLRSTNFYRYTNANVECVCPYPSVTPKTYRLSEDRS